MEQEIAAVVREYGWYAVSVNDRQPTFLYTIGLMQTLNHPEFIMFGLDAENAHGLFTHLIRDIRSGVSYAASGVHAVQMETNEHRVGFRCVHPTQHELYLGCAMGYCRHIGRSGELVAMQVFWPDRHGKFPFDENCRANVALLQPRLDLGLTARELQNWRRQWD